MSTFPLGRSRADSEGMAKRKKWTPKEPLSTIDESRHFIKAGYQAFKAVRGGEDSPSSAFSAWMAAYGPLPVSDEQWLSLRGTFIAICDESNEAPEMQMDEFMRRCMWLEADYVRNMRAAEKAPPRRDGRQPPIPSPFAN